MSKQREVVLGVDSSTQSTKVEVVDLETGENCAEGRAPHTGANVQDPRDWWSALSAAVRMCVDDSMLVRGIAVGGLQHGLVTLDRAGEVVRPAPLWNNVESAEDAEALNRQADFVAAVGSRLVASFTISKLAHFARTGPADLARVHSICLPHDYVTYRLTGNLVSDRSDASGTGWFSSVDNQIRRDLLELAAGKEAADRIKVPQVLGPAEVAGHLTAEAAVELELPAGITVGPGAGDNAAAALGIGATSSELVISLGTSGVAYAVSDIPTYDRTGEVAGFADATGRFLPLSCTINCTRVLNAFAQLFDISIQDALDRAGEVPAGANGLLLSPYLEGERTPNLPHASGSLAGLSHANLSQGSIIRAAVDAVAASLAYANHALVRLGVEKSLVTLVGGGSLHPTWQHAIADATGLPVQVRSGGDHAARGAAIQIAAIVREESLASLVERWRPPVAAEVQPDEGNLPAFRMDERVALIEQARHPD